MKVRRLQVTVFLISTLLMLLIVAPVKAAEPEPDFEVKARSAVLMDAHSGRILYAKDPNLSIAPASLAKIMTMLLALEAIDAGQLSLQDETEISQNAWELALQAGRGAISAMYIEVGEKVTLEDLLYGIGVSSGNDASVAVAEMIAGSEQAFVQQMNERARQLNLQNTHFVDSHGLSPDAYTTAEDMAKLAAFYVQTQPDGLVFANTEEFTYAGIRQRNRNGLLRRDPRVTGLKTGHLGVAGYHLVATAEDGEMSLVAAVLGADTIADREEVALQLLNFGFRNFRSITPAWGSGGQKQLPVYKGEAPTVLVRPAERMVVTVPAAVVDQVVVEEHLPAYLEAPIEQGDEVGSLLIKAADETIAEFQLVAVEPVARGGFFQVIWDSIRLFVSQLIARFT